MRGRLVIALAVLTITAATACAPDAGDRGGRPAGDAVVRRLAPRAGVPYWDEGVHAAGDTTVAVGVLRYRSTSGTQGAWLLASRYRISVLAAEARPLAFLEGAPDFDADFWALDGQYVAAEGSVVASEDPAPRLRVSGLCLVSDIFPTTTNVYHDSGVYDLPDGSKLVRGWTGEVTGGDLSLLDRSPDGTVTPRVIARVKDLKPPDASLPEGMQEAIAYQVEDGPPPRFRLIRSIGWSSGGGTTAMGRPPEWLGIERAGIKDLPGGRHRVVGTLFMAYRTSGAASRTVVFLDEPIASTLHHSYPVDGRIHMVELADPAGVTNALAGSDDYPQTYVGVEGLLAGVGATYTLTVDQAERIPNPDDLAGRARRAVPTTEASLVASVDYVGSAVIIRLNQPVWRVRAHASRIADALMSNARDVRTLIVVDSLGLTCVKRERAEPAP